WVSRPTGSPTAGNRIVVSDSIDGGTTWGSAVAIADRGTDTAGSLRNPHIAGDGAGHWIVTWTDEPGEDVFASPISAVLMESHSLDGGVSWTAPSPISGNTQPRTGFAGVAQIFGDVVSDKSGNWIATWEQFDSTGFEQTFHEVLVTRSTDTGVTWTAPEVLSRISDDDHTPSVAAAGAGRFRIVWSVDFPSNLLRFSLS